MLFLDWPKQHLMNWTNEKLVLLDGKEHIVHDEDDETGDNEMGTVMEDYGEEDKDEKTDKVTDKLTNKQNREELSKESEKEEAGDSEDAVKDMVRVVFLFC